MDHEQFLSRLTGVRQVRKGQWQAKCPAHDDDTPSLAIGTGQGGRILIHCHSGCTVQAVLAAMGLMMKDLYRNTQTKRQGRAAARARRGGWQSVEEAIVYYERKLDGALAGDWAYPGGTFHMLRVNLPDGDKAFRPVHREGHVWRAGDPRGRLPLYRADKLPPDGPVFVTEGEKCADAVAALGLAAVTSAHGAESARKSDWGLLGGRDCCIWPDNDGPGTTYAETVAAILTRLNPPARVRILPIPDGLPPGGDVVDWVELDGRDSRDDETLRAELLAMAEGAPLWAPSLARA